MSLGAVNSNKIKSSNGDYFISHGWATDYDLDSCQTYLNNIQGDENTVIHRNVKDLKINILPKIRFRLRISM